MSTLENPFHPHIKGPGETNSAKDVELAKTLLGDADAALLASVQGGRTERTALASSDSVMTDEEREMLVNAEAKEHENVWDRERYVAWAQSIGRSERWVDNTFVFNDDSTVETKGDLDLSHIESLSSFPPNLTTVKGGLYLDRITSADNLVFPQTVDGWLVLEYLPAADGLTLPQTVDGSLCLFHLTSANNTIWPTHIGTDLYIPRAFSAQAEQLKASGVLKGDIKYT